MLLLRRCDDDRMVPWRDKPTGLFCCWLGLLLHVDVSCWETLPGLRFRSIVRDIESCGGVECCDEPGLRRSEGLRRARKLCDLALRILGRWWLEEEEEFNLC